MKCIFKILLFFYLVIFLSSCCCCLGPGEPEIKPYKTAVIWPKEWGKPVNNSISDQDDKYNVIYLNKNINHTLDFGFGWKPINVYTSNDRLYLNDKFKPHWQFGNPTKWLNTELRKIDSKIPTYTIKAMHYSCDAFQISDEKIEIEKNTIPSLGKCKWPEKWQRPNIIYFELTGNRQNKNYGFPILIKDLPNNVSVENIYKEYIMD